jgi:hypothetical protein
MICQYCGKKMGLLIPEEQRVTFCSKDHYDLMIAEVVRSARGGGEKDL